MLQRLISAMANFGALTPDTDNSEISDNASRPSGTNYCKDNDSKSCDNQDNDSDSDDSFTSEYDSTWEEDDKIKSDTRKVGVGFLN